MDSLEQESDVMVIRASEAYASTARDVRIGVCMLSVTGAVNAGVWHIYDISEAFRRLLESGTQFDRIEYRYPEVNFHICFFIVEDHPILDWNGGVTVLPPQMAKFCRLSRFANH